MQSQPDGRSALAAAQPHAHPSLSNLFGAGVWTLADRDERLRLNTLAGRAQLGEAAGQAAAAAKAPDVEAPPLSGSILTPPHFECDVLVIGGGTAGALAAIAAARQGAKVTLLESTAVLGGIGSISGAMVGGLLLGVAENLSSAYISSGYRDVIAFLAMILTLVIKPTGLMGFKFEEKV